MKRIAFALIALLLIRGYYRSSTLRLPSLAWVLYIYNDDHKMDGSSFGRFYGYSIRPVIK